MFEMHLLDNIQNKSENCNRVTGTYIMTHMPGLLFDHSSSIAAPFLLFLFLPPLTLSVCLSNEDSRLQIWAFQFSFSLLPWDCSWRTANNTHINWCGCQDTRLHFASLTQVPNLWVFCTGMQLGQNKIKTPCGYDDRVWMFVDVTPVCFAPLQTLVPSLTRPWPWGLDHHTAEQGKEWKN